MLDGARVHAFDLCSSPVLMVELLDVLSREKFAARFAQAGLVPLEIVSAIRRLATMAVPASVPRVIVDDADDDHVLACALAGNAHLIGSGGNGSFSPSLSSP